VNAAVAHVHAIDDGITKRGAALNDPAAHQISTHHQSRLATPHYAKPPERARQIRRSSRRRVFEPHSARPARIITPGAVCRQPRDKIIKQNFCAVLHREPREAIGTGALAHVAAQANEHIWKIDEPSNPHSANRTYREHSSTVPEAAGPRAQHAGIGRAALSAAFRSVSAATTPNDPW